MTNPIKRAPKTADIIAGTVAVLLALPSLEAQTNWALERFTLILLMVLSLFISWYLAQNRYWMVKIFLYAGVMLLFMLIARLCFYIAAV